MAPLTLFFFGRAPMAAVPANLVLFPVFTFLVPVFLLGVVLLGLWPWAGAGLIRAGVAVLHVMWPAWTWLARHAPGPLPVAAPPLMLVALALAGLLLVLAPRGWPGRIAGLGPCPPLLLWRPPGPPMGGFRLAVLDVGEGLSAVVSTHAHTLVFDTGPAYPGGFDAGRSVLVPYLHWAGVHYLDTLVLSHGDLDHHGGAPALLEGYPGPRRLGWHGRHCRAGRSWRWDGVTFRFLHPDGPRWQGNNASCVLRVSAGGHAAMLTGDIQVKAERHLVATRLRRLHAGVLVAPRHGSTTSSTPAFVRSVDPEYMLFPAGWDNRWGFPKPAVVERYRKEGAIMRVTGRSGALIVNVSADGPSAPVEWRRHHHRFWSFRP